MNISQRVKRAVVNWLLSSETSYDAAEQYSPRRSRITGAVRDARFDASPRNRIEIVRKTRHFERNNAIVNRLSDLFEQYTVGPQGLRFVPSSSDPKWNKNASSWWDDWTPFADIASLQSFGTLQSLTARSWMIDGELFILKTNGKQRQDGQSFPRIQLIETQRVGTPDDYLTDKNVFDGIRINPDNGRPVGYYVNDGYADASHKFRIASDVIHVMEPVRPGMYRGLPMFYPVINDLIDLDDLQMLEMDAAKEAASVTNVIKTKSGELNMEEMRRARFTVDGAQGTSGGSNQERSLYYQDVFEGRAKVLKVGDDITQFKTDRPSIASQGYWDYLTSKVCAGVGISKLLVYPWSMQGTVTRADLDVASSFFRARSYVLGSKFREVWEYVMDWANHNVRTLSDPPHDWRKVSVRPPRSVNVDVGRNATALIAEYKAGWRTLESICGELGEDWNEVIRQRAIERRKARDTEKEFDLEPGELIDAALEAIAASQPVQIQEHQTNQQMQGV